MLIIGLDGQTIIPAAAALDAATASGSSAYPSLAPSDMLITSVHGPAVVGLMGRPDVLALDSLASRLLNSVILSLRRGIVEKVTLELLDAAPLD